MTRAPATGRTPGGLRRRLGITAVAALALTSCAAAAGAQEAESSPRAWLGIGLEETCQRSEGGADWSCSSAPIVQSIVLESPADRAGLLPGDRLMSIDGADLATPAGDQALSKLEVGRTVAFVVARGEEKLEVTVEPAPWPEQHDIVLARTLPSSRAVGPRIVTLPRVAIYADSVAPDVELYVDSTGIRSYSYRFRLPDGSVQEFSAPRIDVPLRLEMSRPGTPDDVLWNSYMVAELLQMARNKPDSVAAAEYYEAARHLRAQYEAEVVPRLRATYDTALARARVQLDSLRTTIDRPARYAERGAEPARRSGVRVYVETRELTGGRVAGAEFEELNPDLADAIGATGIGVDEGLFVVRVLDGTPAAAAGLRSGDLLVEAAGGSIGSVSMLRRALQEDQAIEVTWIRKGERISGRLGGD